ncbi:MAG: four helix bundle suffix domain-containing protein [Candidatus Aureabacteria bacterium]|nr:four helix bundle suffix domain-containing protein [Candidatus Auribacterota bacterium]
MPENEPLIPKHGGYRNLKSFQMAQLVYDVTVRFCDRYIDRRSRTQDQMVQAARSGVQNIAEGSQASGTSKKMELKLTNVARASLEELRLDYEDFLRHRGLERWSPDHPALQRFKAQRCSTMEEVRAWVREEKARGQTGLAEDKHGLIKNDTDQHGRTRTDTDPKNGPGGPDKSVSVPVSPCPSMPSSGLVANAALSLLNLCCYLLDRQLAAQAKSFETEGGFTERLFRTRQSRRGGTVSK